MGYKNILFDMDGTLSDPYVGISNGIIYSLQKFNITERDEAKFKMFIGPPLNQSFMEIYNFDSSTAKDAVKYYREYYSEKGIFENRLYEGIDTVLKTLTQNNKNCMVATSKPTEFAVRILKYFNISEYFQDVIGSNLDGTFSEKEEIIKSVIEKHNLDKAETVMIGDKKHDINGAHKNDIDSVAVMYGYGSVEELEAAKPTYLCSSVQGILEVMI